MVGVHPLVAAQRSALDRLCRKFHVRKLELFGSATTDRFDVERSDLDFLVEFLPVPFGQHAKAYFGLLFALEDLFGRSIDLVETEAIENPYFLQAIQPTRVTIYAAARGEEILV